MLQGFKIVLNIIMNKQFFLQFRTQQTDFLYQSRQSVQCGSLEYPFRIEIPVQHLEHRLIAVTGRHGHCNPHSDLIRAVQINLIAGEGFASQFFPSFAQGITQMQKNSFYMLAGTQSVGTVITTGAGIDQLLHRTDVHSIVAFSS